MDLTSAQLRSFNREKERRQQLKSDEIMRRVENQMDLLKRPKRNVCQVLRIRVVDSKKPNNTALFSIFNPSEDIEHLVKPGSFIEVTGAIASKQEYGKELLISSGKTTIIKNIRRLSNNLVKLPPYLRVLTPFSACNESTFAPLHNEFDIICMVVKVDERLPPNLGI